MSDASEAESETGIVSKNRSGSVADAVVKLTELVEAHGMKIFTIVDHSGEARRIGLDLSRHGTRYLW